MLSSKTKRMWRVSRLVVHPDYQGVGIGTKFLNAVSDMEMSAGNDVRITTSARNMVHALKGSQNWICTNYGFNKNKNQLVNDAVHKVPFANSARHCKTASFKRVAHG